jgi:hypothetical protein
MAMEAATTAVAAMRPSMAIMPTATTIVTAGRTAATCMAGTPVNTTVDIPVSTTTYTRAADILLVDILLADNPQADIPQADNPQADTPLVAESITGNL